MSTSFAFHNCFPHTTKKLEKKSNPFNEALSKYLNLSFEYSLLWGGKSNNRKRYNITITNVILFLHFSMPMCQLGNKNDGNN